MIFVNYQILDILNQEGCPIRDKEIATRLDMDVYEVKEMLLYFQKENRISQTESGRWEIVMSIPRSSPGNRAKGSRGPKSRKNVLTFSRDER